MVLSSARRVWKSLEPYVALPFAAALAIVPAYRDMAATRFLQRGLPVPSMTGRQVVKGGVGAMPTVGVLVGTQMVLQGRIEQALVKFFVNFLILQTIIRAHIDYLFPGF